jgi:ribonuclease J
MKKFLEHKLYFIPLGGCGIFGANLSLYGTKGKWLMVDCGMGFGDDTMPGVDIILPDIRFLEDILEDVVGMVVTHGHEDHIGGIEHLWPRIKKPIYAAPFTIGLIAEKLAETSWGRKVSLHTLEDDTELELGPFLISTIKMAHSIPEMRSLKITAGDCGSLLHTGDWKLDPDPVAGDITDNQALQKLAADNLLAVVGDSTNAMVPGHSGSEAEVLHNMTELFSEFDGRIAVSCFSSNVARLVSISKAAVANNRHVCLVGRSLWRIERVARKCGYLDDVPDFIDADDAQYLSRNQVIYACTGSQGESRAALARIANNDHRSVKLEEGDVVMFSSRSIPGNEKAIDRLKNRLLGHKVTILTDRDAPIHVSGHPYRDEIRLMLDWVKPRYVLPVHGERMQMERHADLAEECGYTAPVIPMNGDIIEISEKGMSKVGEVPSGMLAIEGKRLVPVDHEAIQMRRRMMHHGSAVVTIVLDQSGRLMADPKVTAVGLFDEENEDDTRYSEEAAMAVREKLENMPKREGNSDYPVEEAARIAARRYFEAQFSKKPQTRVHLVRI